LKRGSPVNVATKGIKTKAAELLGVTGDSLKYRIEQLGMEQKKSAF
jgi:DNA-binding protein Fis